MMPGSSDTEATPLLQDSSRMKAHELVYKRFSDSQKKAIVSMVSMCGLLPLFMAGSFIPCIPQIANDLETTGGTVSYAVSISVFAMAIGSLVGSSYSGFYGRRPVYCCLLPFSVIGSIGVAVSPSIPHLLFWRFLQAFGVSSGMSVGAGVIGDIYKLEERGTAMGVFFAAILLGPALAPLAGGAAAHYASWRIMQVVLAVVTLGVLIPIVLFFPETSHPGTRGIDKLSPATPERGLEATSEEETRGSFSSLFRSKMPVILNPFEALLMLRSPNLLAMAMVIFLILAVDYILLIPISYTIGRKYGLTNEAFIGACFIPNGIGSMIGAPLAGRISDRTISRLKAERGRWYPEDRLRAALLPALTLVPMSAIASGWLTTYVDGWVGLGGNLVCLFLNGLGIDMVFSPCSAYLVDIVHSKSAESVAANSAFRAALLALWIMLIFPMVETYGVLAANCVAACLGWVGFGCLWAVIRYGEAMRGWVDVGYSTEEDN